MHKLTRIASYFVLISLFALLWAKGVRPAWTTVHSDFANYYVAAKLVRNNVNLDSIYDNNWFQNKIKESGINTPGKFSPFPPITAFLLLPLTSFNPLTAQRVFTILNLIFLGIGIFVLRGITSWPWVLCSLLVLLSGLGLINNIAFGQVYWIMTVFLLLACQCLEKNKWILAAVILAFFTSLKYFPIVMMGSYFCIGLLNQKEGVKIRENTYLKTALTSALLVLLLFAFQYFYFGWEVMNAFIRSSFLPHLNGDLSGQNTFAFQFQSWDTLLKNIFVYDPAFNPHPLINWPAGKLFFKCFVFLGVLGITFSLLFRFRNKKNKDFVFLSLPFVAALTLLPASATYHFILLLLPMMWLLSRPEFRKQAKVMLIGLYSLIGFIPYSVLFQLSKSGNIFLAFPRLWLMLILFLAVANEVNHVAKKSVINN